MFKNIYILSLYLFTRLFIRININTVYKNLISINCHSYMQAFWLLKNEKEIGSAHGSQNRTTLTIQLIYG